MRKTTISGASLLALVAGAWLAAAHAQAPDQSAPPPPSDSSAPSASDTGGSGAPSASDTGGTTGGPSASTGTSMHHHRMHHSSKAGKLAPTSAGNQAVEDLNDASLNAAKDGKPFNPSSVPTPPAAQKAARYGSDGSTHMMHHHAKKHAPKSSDTAGSSDTSSSNGGTPSDTGTSGAPQGETPSSSTTPSGSSTGTSGQ